MALITRLSRLLTADLHAVLDHLEEPDILLKQAIRDMQASIAAAQQELDDLERQRARTAAGASDLRARREAAEAELDVCLTAGNDELARAVIRRGLEFERTLADLERAQAELEAAIADRTSVLDLHQQELAILSSRAAVFETRACKHAERTWPGAVSPEDVDVALLKAKQTRARS